MRKQFILMFLASMAGGGLATVLMQKKNPFELWAASGTRAVVLSRDAVCPPGFTDITSAQNGRYLLADNTVSGTVNQGGGTPPGATPGGHQLSVAEMPSHNHAGGTNVMEPAQVIGNQANGYFGAPGFTALTFFGSPHQHSHNGGDQPHNHPYSGFRLCEWTVN